MGIYHTTGKTITPIVAANIARRLHELRLTHNDLHEKAKLAYSTIARIINGQGDDISHASAARILDLLQTTWFALSHEPVPPILLSTPTGSDALFHPFLTYLSAADACQIPLCATSAGFNSLASLGDSAPLREPDQFVIRNPFSASIPVHNIPTHPLSTLTSGRQAPLLHQLYYALKASSLRALLVPFFHKIGRFLHAAFNPRPPSHTQLQLALDYTETYYPDGESEQENFPCH